MGAVAGRVEQGRAGGAVRLEPCGWREREVPWTPLPWGVYGERVDAVASEGFGFEWTKGSAGYGSECTVPWWHYART